MTFVYHLMPKQLEGNVLYPLNQLKTLYPSLYEQQRQKYLGREEMMERKIPLLQNCFWNDVLFFTSVHPSAIKHGFLSVGKTWKTLKWGQIDIQKGYFSADNTVVYYPDVSREIGNFTLQPDRFSLFEPARIITTYELPQVTIAYYRECVTNQTTIFAWRGLPHILYRGSISIDDIEVIEV